MIPTSIVRKSELELEIIWHDQSKSLYSSETLRRNCPCAQCREDRGENSHNQPLTTTLKKTSLLKVVESSKAESLSIKKVWLIGNYAIGILWGDGHNDGIYSFDLLLKLSTYQ